MVSIIIVTWNNIKEIKECLFSIHKQSFKDYEIIVVDNGSSDGTLEFLKNYPQPIILIENSKNLGYCKANNIGIKMAKGEFIFFLNADTILEDFTLEILVKSLKSDSELGSVSGKILKMKDKNIIDSTGILLNRVKMSPRDRGEWEVDKGDYNNKEYIFGITGAAALYKRETLEDIKLGDEYFDEDFFAYYEDVDLAWRAQLRGWKALYNPKAIIYHDRKGADLKPTYIYNNFFKNKYLMFLKNEPFFMLFDYWYVRYGYEILRILNRLMEKPTLIYSIFVFFRLLPKILKKRRTIQKRKRVSNDYLRSLK